MKKLLVIISFASIVNCLGLMALKPAPAVYNFPSYNPNFPPPQGYTNPFSLSQQYPDSYDTTAVYPWQSIDFKTNPMAYMKAVLGYDLEGNVDVDFVVQNNRVRKWYHVPWLHDDGKKAGDGREYIHGLTRERATPIKELDDQQDLPLENWAIGFYNEPGGFTIGRVWKNSVKPMVAGNVFPEGTTAFKLLFTDGTTDKVPFLQGTKEWTANIYPCDPTTTCQNRVNRTVRLLQIDIAVKDKRSPLTGWVFGTFIYDASSPGTTVWDRMVPVGLMWGNDGEITDMMHTAGSFINPKLSHTFLNTALLKTPASGGIKAYMSHFGLGGRLDGPVDNPVSSCISCHGRAANLPNGKAAAFGDFNTTIATYPLTAFKKYFAEVPGGTGQLMQAGQSYTQTDYSLQLANGIRNYYQHQILVSNSAIHQNTSNGKKAAKPVKSLPLVTRGGD